MKSKVEATQSKLEELKSEIEKESSNFDFIQADESVARKLQGDMAVIEKSERDIAGFNRLLISQAQPSQDSQGKVAATLKQNPLPNPFLAAKPVTELQKERDEWRAKR